VRVLSTLLARHHSSSPHPVISWLLGSSDWRPNPDSSDSQTYFGCRKFLHRWGSLWVSSRPGQSRQASLDFCGTSKDFSLKDSTGTSHSSTLAGLLKTSWNVSVSSMWPPNGSTLPNPFLLLAVLPELKETLYCVYSLQHKKNSNQKIQFKLSNQIF